MLEPLVFTDSDKALFKATFAPNATSDQFNFFINECQRRRLIPGTHVVFQLRNSQEYSQQLQRSVSVQKVTLITTINALRLIAERPGKFRGYGKTTYYYTDPSSNDFQPTVTSLIPLGRIPHAVSMELFREGWAQPVFAVARFDAYVQTKKDGNKEVPTRMWQLRGEEQLAKCAEAAGLRMVAPEECGGLYIAEEFERESKEELVVPSVADTTDHIAPIVPTPTVAPAINQAPAPVEPELLHTAPDLALVKRALDEAKPGQTVTVGPALPAPVPALPKPAPAAPAPVARPAVPPPAPRPAAPPPLPLAPPKAAAGAPAAPPLLDRQPADDAPVRESVAELAQVADAVARDKDPKPGPFANTTPPNPENETRAFPNPTPAAVASASPAQSADYPKPTPTVALPVASAPTGEAPATPEEFGKFVNGRGAKIVRDKLKDVKNAGAMLKDYLLRESGKQKLQAISAPTFERLLSTLEAATVEEAVKVMKG